MAHAGNAGSPSSASPESLESLEGAVEVASDINGARDSEDPWERYVAKLRACGIPVPGAWRPASSAAISSSLSPLRATSTRS